MLDEDRVTLQKFYPDFVLPLAEASSQHDTTDEESVVAESVRHAFLIQEAKRIYALPQQNVSKGLSRFEEYAHPFYHAALAGDALGCEALLRHFHPDLIWQPILHDPYDEDHHIEYFGKGNTPLFAPVFHDHHEAMRVVLAYGLKTDENGEPYINVNATNAGGATALYSAVQFGAAKCAQLLLAAGADPSIRPTSSYSSGDTVLHIARCRPDTQTHDESALIRMLPLLVAANMRLSQPNWLERKNSLGMTPLHCHAKAANAQICLELIRLGADVNAETEYGETPLQLAITGRGISSFRVRHDAERNRRSDLCMKLIEAGANIDRSSPPRDESYYALAFAYGLFQLCDELIQKGVVPKQRANAGELLCSAVKYKRVDLFERLVALGADVNAYDRFQQTPLHWAVREQHVDLSKRLIQLGADPNAKNERDETPIFGVLSRFRNHRGEFRGRNPEQTRQDAHDLLKLLLDAGADVMLETRLGTRAALGKYDNMPPEFRQLIDAHRE